MLIKVRSKPRRPLFLLRRQQVFPRGFLSTEGFQIGPPQMYLIVQQSQPAIKMEVAVGDIHAADDGGELEPVKIIVEFARLPNRPEAKLERRVSYAAPPIQ